MHRFMSVGLTLREDPIANFGPTATKLDAKPIIDSYFEKKIVRGPFDLHTEIVLRSRIA